MLRLERPVKIRSQWSEVRGQYFSARHPEPCCLLGTRSECSDAVLPGNINKRIVKDLMP
jgi:hypothetical protein